MVWQRWCRKGAVVRACACSVPFPGAGRGLGRRRALARPQMRSRRILIAAVGSEGDVRPLLAIGRVLRQRGHDVRLASHALHASLVAQAGLDFIDASGIDLPEDPGEFARRAFRRFRGPRFVIRDFAAADVAASHARMAAACDDDVDMVLTSTLAFAGQILAQQRGWRWVSVVLAPAGLLSDYQPPATGWARLDRFAAGSPARAALLRRFFEAACRRWTARLRRFRIAQGLSAEPLAGNPMLRGQHAPGCSLALFPAWFGAPQPDWPVQMQQTGFCFLRAPEEELSPQLSEFLDTGAPPLVFSLGSAAVHAGERFLQESLAATRQLGARAVLLAGSPAMRQRLPRILPPGVLATDAAPHRLLFPHASVVVHHGGIGTSAEALRAGRGMLVVPHGFDQFDNAARLQALGVAEVLPAPRYRAAGAAQRLQSLLDEPRYRRRAMDAAQRLCGSDGAQAAADAVEAQLQK